MKAIILAAGMSKRLRPYTENFPKCLLKINGKSILSHILEVLKNNSINNISVIRGHAKDKLNLDGLKYYENPDYRNNNILHSLMYAREEIENTNEDIIVSYSDIIYEDQVIKDLINSKSPISVVVDTEWQDNYSSRTDHPIEEAENVIFDNDLLIKKIGKNILVDNSTKNHSEFIGLWKFTSEGAKIFLKHFDRLNSELKKTDQFQNAREWQKAYITDIFQEMVDMGEKIHCTLIKKGWKEFDTIQDFLKAGGDHINLNKEQYKTFSELLNKSQPIVAVGAHDAITAKLVEESGFGAVWASGFAINASRALPDAKLTDMSEFLRRVEDIVNAVNIPVIVDGDDGFGTAIHAARLAERCFNIGVAALCIEDNVSDEKKCSFYDSGKRNLVPIQEFQGKLKAIKSRAPDLILIARTESFIAGYGLEEALKRAKAFAEAGADMILIHSKIKTPDEVFEFAKNFNLNIPLVCVPTTYDTTTVESLSQNKYKLIIFANQPLRAAVKSMREALITLKKNLHASSLNHLIVPMDEIYKLTKVEELNIEEERFIPKEKPIKVIIPAAGYDPTLSEAKEIPKCMIKINNKTLFEHQIDLLKHFGINNIVMVRGFKKELICLKGPKYYDNEDYLEKGLINSLKCAKNEFTGNDKILLLWSDILLEPNILERLLKQENDITLLVDHSILINPQRLHKKTKKIELVKTTYTPSIINNKLINLQNNPNFIEDIGTDIPQDKATGEFIGVTLLSERAAKKFYDYLSNLSDPSKIGKGSYPEFIRYIMKQGEKINILGVLGGWFELHDLEDYQKAINKGLELEANDQG